MNDLSWMLYWADVVGNISLAAGFVMFGGGAAGAIISFVVAMKTDIDNIGRHGEPLPAWATGWAAGKKFFVASLIAAVITTPIPSKDTIYAIAASEMGEEALKSPIATKASKALEKWLDSQIDEKAPAK